jgi:hypothetical protein
MKTSVIILLLLIATIPVSLAKKTYPVSRYMQLASPGFQPPPPGKTLVLIHRPAKKRGDILYARIWDSRHFIADLGNGHSAAYVCEPGKHYFISRSVERAGVIEAELLPDRVYVLRINTTVSMIASFQVEPVKAGEHFGLAQCEEDNLWVTRSGEAAGYEASRQAEIDLILKDFVGGPKADRIRYLAPTDFRP